MKQQTWKSHERRVAARLGGRRLGATGVSNEDVSTPTLAIECKHRSSLPAWLGTALTKVRAHGKQQGKAGIVVIHELGRHDSLCLLALSDFVRLTGQDVPDSVRECNVPESVSP